MNLRDRNLLHICRISDQQFYHFCIHIFQFRHHKSLPCYPFDCTHSQGRFFPTLEIEYENSGKVTHKLSSNRAFRAKSHWAIFENPPKKESSTTCLHTHIMQMGCKMQHPPPHASCGWWWSFPSFRDISKNKEDSGDFQRNLQ